MTWIIHNRNSSDQSITKINKPMFNDILSAKENEFLLAQPGQYEFKSILSVNCVGLHTRYIIWVINNNNNESFCNDVCTSRNILYIANSTHSHIFHGKR